MAMISTLRSLLPRKRPDLYAILDVGTVEVKALIVLIEGEQASIVGSGQQAHPPGAIVDGSLADTGLAAKTCEYALGKAEAQTEAVAGERLVADHAILGLCGPMLRGINVSLSARRAHPQHAMSDRELRSIVQRAERLLVQQARETEATSGRPDVELAVLDAHLMQVLVDGQPVTSRGALTGAQVEVHLANILAPAPYLTAAGKLATSLDMQPVAVTSGCCALGRMPAIANQGDAIVIDVGGECTDIMIRRHGGAVALQTLPVGGMAFTRCTARALGVPLAAAEDIKRAYAGGQIEQERSANLRLALADDVRAWVDGIQTLLKQMAGHDDLPPQIVLGGGGSALPDLGRAMRLYPWTHVLPFARSPQVTTAQAYTPANLSDRTQQTGGPDFAVAVALASWVVQAQRPAAAGKTQQILHQVLHGMGYCER
jgi:hypothetical protein